MSGIREEFEAWVRTQVPEPSHATALAYSAGNDLYLNPHIQGRYEGWQASRAALRVELPAERDETLGNSAVSEYQATKNQGFNDCLERVTEALQQAGIEVK
ncbi:hypothetical protein IB260_00560 [Pseudomonas sp. PDM23]|uniref:hypothetical protein n=1 Tax=unclassified Pseudomonas TaxID=196821 RepID=UPI0017846EF7|nr:MULTISPECIES: hypothetical protein [unclassified Pseudomonas]MBD9573785.1 hypothetical protein [Pseudomonas sp. PDM23]MBD9671623.1 hypothetical protein [Pseudomonas sp. PDM21]